MRLDQRHTSHSQDVTLPRGCNGEVHDSKISGLLCRTVTHRLAVPASSCDAFSLLVMGVQAPCRVAAEMMIVRVVVAAAAGAAAILTPQTDAVVASDLQRQTGTWFKRIGPSAAERWQWRARLTPLLRCCQPPSHLTPAIKELWCSILAVTCGIPLSWQADGQQWHNAWAHTANI